MAGITHIMIILTLPYLLGENSYIQLSKMAQTQQLTLLKTIPTPFADSMLTQGLCLYDLSKGMLHLHADTIPDHFLSFSFHTKEGRVFYALTDQAGQNGKIDVLVLNEKQLDSLPDDDDDNDEHIKELRLVAPDEKGFILIKALSAFPSEATEMAALVKSVTCQLEAITIH
jgi:uncharacterized membrane protein